MSTSLSIIILSYNRPQDTLKCLSYLRHSDIPPKTKFIVINNSQSESDTHTLQAIKVDKFIQSKRNLGFAGGNNLAIKNALDEYNSKKILIINPDVVVPKKMFKSLIKKLDSLPHAGLIAPVHKHYQKQIPFYGMGGIIDWRLGKCIHENTQKIRLTRPKKYDFVSFACVLIKSEVFQRTGLLDERYFMYLEDVDFCIQAKKQGFFSYIDPSTIVTHNTSSSFSKPTDKLKYSFTSSLKFIYKNLPPRRRVLPLLHTLFFYPYLYLLWSYHARKYKN